MLQNKRIWNVLINFAINKTVYTKRTRTTCFLFFPYVSCFCTDIIALAIYSSDAKAARAYLPGNFVWNSDAGFIFHGGIWILPLQIRSRDTFGDGICNILCAAKHIFWAFALNWFCLFSLSAMTDDPRFAEPIPNVTVALGRDASLPCVVENLGKYKVNTIPQCILNIYQLYNFPLLCIC